MKIKVSSIYKGCIFILMALNLSLFKIFGGIISDTGFIIEITAVISIILCLIFWVKKGIKKDFLTFMLLLMSVTLLLAIKTSIDAGKTISNAVLYSLKYWYVFLAVPLYEMLKCNWIKFNVLLKWIVNFTMISYLLRATISVIEKFTGVLILKNIALEYAADNWYRNGWLRIIPPAFGMIVIPIGMYFYYNSKNRMEKIRYTVVIAFSLLYSAIISGARSITLYQVIIIVFIILFKRKTAKRQLKIFLIISVMAVVLINSNFGENFLDSFLSTGEYAGSTTGRLEALPFYFSEWMKHPITGTGFLHYEQRMYTGKVGWTVATLGDLGVFFTIVQVGIGGMIFYIALFARGIRNGNRARILSPDKNLDILAWGIVVAVLLTGINIDLFYGIYAFSAPFCMAIIEYVRAISNEADCERAGDKLSI